MYTCSFSLNVRLLRFWKQSIYWSQLRFSLSDSALWSEAHACPMKRNRWKENNTQCVFGWHVLHEQSAFKKSAFKHSSRKSADYKRSASGKRLFPKCVLKKCWGWIEKYLQENSTISAAKSKRGCNRSRSRHAQSENSAFRLRHEHIR